MRPGSNGRPAVDAWPLSWPHGWPRTSSYQRGPSRFRGNDGGRLTITAAARRVVDALRLMGVSDDAVIVSTNVRPTLSGLPASGERAPTDPGAAVYWSTPKAPGRCMAIDRYSTVSENLAAIAATLDAMRAIERHGGAAILDRAFAGFVALPSAKTAWQILGVREGADPAEIRAAYRRKAAEHHPDRGGDSDLMARINAARDELLSEALR